jgi:hypothetical protein
MPGEEHLSGQQDDSKLRSDVVVMSLVLQNASGQIVAEGQPLQKR